MINQQCRYKWMSYELDKHGRYKWYTSWATGTLRHISATSDESGHFATVVIERADTSLHVCGADEIYMGDVPCDDAT